ncbi:MAG: hypothetical protein HY902_15915 [Deltaproteobacteria bacterium]|nr:hypothetical protein [Deltaproteobacteria bacterium]
MRYLKYGVVAGAMLLAACGSEDQFGTEANPVLSLQVEGKAPPSGTACTNFTPDATRGQTKYHKQILIKNTATVGTKTPKALCVKWEIKDSNSQLKITPPSNLPTDPDCTGDWKTGLSINSAGIAFDIEYAANESGDSEPVKITFATNDPDAPTKVLCFGIASVGAVCQLEPSAFTFTNVTAANPQTACFSLRNSGNASLAFKGAGIDPANSQYTITAQPNSDETLPGMGTPENIDGSKTLKICVRYSPDSDTGNEKATLVVLTTGQPAECKSSLDAQTQDQANFNISCTEATGKKIFSFPDPIAGSAKCKICGEGPPPLKIQNVLVKAYTEAGQTKADANYKAQMVDVAGNPQTLYALNKDKCIDVVVNYTPQGGLPGPPAYVAFTFSSVGISNEGSIPIVPGDCDTPQPDFGPIPVRAQAAVGETWTTTLSIANQSCGGLTITNICPYDSGYTGKDPCSAPSKHFALAKGFATTTVPGFGLINVDVNFKPANGNKKTINDALFIQYCPGTFASGTCGVELASRVVSLAGTVAFDTTPKVPTATLSVITAADKIVVGKPVNLAMGAADLGGFTDLATKYYWWTISKRPEGSAAWIPAEFQGTSATANLSVIPDAPGEYEVSGQVQLISETGSDAYSPQVKVKFTAK